MTLVYVLTTIFVLLICYGVLLNYVLKTERYEIVSDKIHSSGCRIALLTDLHGCTHGRENRKLLAAIKRCSPDIVCIAGDLTVKDGKCADRMLQFLSFLSERYPVIYAPGNHEIRMPEYGRYRERIRNMKIHYLENQSYVWKNGLVFAGLDLPEYWYHKFWEKRKMTEEVIHSCLGENDAGKFTVLLAHNPEYFPSYAAWGADLTLSGHVHGGIARLPFFGGVIEPSLRLFPKYDAGEFTENNKKMIISRGLGYHHIKFRFHNPPELSVIDLKSKRRQA